MDLYIKDNFDKEHWPYRYVIIDRDSLEKVRAYTNDTEIRDTLNEKPYRTDYCAEDEYRDAKRYYELIVSKATKLYEEASLKEAIRYISDNKTWTQGEEDEALEIIGMNRCPIEYASDRISGEIERLMEDFTDDNNLPEDWWSKYTDIDGIFFSLD